VHLALRPGEGAGRRHLLQSLATVISTGLPRSKIRGGPVRIVFRSFTAKIEAWGLNPVPPGLSILHVSKHKTNTVTIRSSSIFQSTVVGIGGCEETN